MQIISISKEGKKYWVTVEQEEPFWLYGTELRQWQLEAGAELTKERYNVIMEQTVTKRAVKRALHLLAKSDYTSRQMRQKLKQNGYPPCAIDETISYAQQHRYIDDRRFAEHYILLHKEQDSQKKIKMDLQRRGIAEPLFRELLEQEAGREKEQIRCWLEKKQYPQKARDEKEKGRLYRFLLRKGYKSSEILSEMRAAEQESLP